MYRLARCSKLHRGPRGTPFHCNKYLNEAEMTIKPLTDSLIFTLLTTPRFSLHCCHHLFVYMAHSQWGPHECHQEPKGGLWPRTNKMIINNTEMLERRKTEHSTQYIHCLAKQSQHLNITKQIAIKLLLNNDCINDYLSTGYKLINPNWCNEFLLIS